MHVLAAAPFLFDLTYHRLLHGRLDMRDKDDTPDFFFLLKTHSALLDRGAPFAVATWTRTGAQKGIWHLLWNSSSTYE